MPEFTIRTHEMVEGSYIVIADSEQEARAKFDRKPGQLIDWQGVEQTDYMAFDVEVQAVSDESETQ